MCVRAFARTNVCVCVRVCVYVLCEQTNGFMEKERALRDAYNTFSSTSNFFVFFPSDREREIERDGEGGERDKHTHTFICIC